MSVEAEGATPSPRPTEARHRKRPAWVQACDGHLAWAALSLDKNARCVHACAEKTDGWFRCLPVVACMSDMKF